MDRNDVATELLEYIPDDLLLLCPTCSAELVGFGGKESKEINGGIFWTARCPDCIARWKFMLIVDEDK